MSTADLETYITNAVHAADKWTTRSTEDLEDLQQELIHLMSMKREALATEAMKSNHLGEQLQYKLAKLIARRREEGAAAAWQSIPVQLLPSHASSSSDDFVVVAGGAEAAPSMPAHDPSKPASSSSSTSSVPAPEMRKGRAFIFLMLDSLPLVWDTNHVEALLKVVKSHADVNGTIDTSAKGVYIVTAINPDQMKLGGYDVFSVLADNSSLLTTCGEKASAFDLGEHMQRLPLQPTVEHQTHGDVVILLHCGIFKESMKIALNQMVQRGIRVKHLYIRDPNYYSPSNDLEKETAARIRAANIQAEVLEEVLTFSAAQHEKALAASIAATEEQVRLSLEDRVRAMKDNSTAEIARSAKRLAVQWTSALKSARIFTIPHEL
jgi:hypothetical protein